MIDSKFRGFWQKIFIDKLALFCHRLGLSPAHLTLTAFILGILVLPALAFKQEALAVFLLISSGLLDTSDGTLARLQKCASNSGSILDIACDRGVEFSVVLGLYFYDPSRGLWLLLLLGSFYLCVTTFLLSGIFTPNQSNKSFHYSPGLIERAETFIYFPLAIIFPLFFKYLTLVFCFLVFLTAIRRFFQMYFNHIDNPIKVLQAREKQ